MALESLASVPKHTLNKVLEDVKRESEFQNLMKVLKKLQSNSTLNQNVAAKEN